MSKTITVKELHEKVIAGEITIDTCGHKLRIDTDRIKSTYDRNIDKINGGNDGEWGYENRKNKTKEEVDSDMRDFYKRRFDQKFSHGEILAFESSFGENNKCCDCGRDMKPRLDLENNKLVYSCYIEDWKGYDPVFEKADTCEMAGKTKFESVISVTSQLIFANHFGEDIFDDSPEKEKWSDEYSLCHLKGRERITKHLEGQNCAYGQLTNTSFDIFLSDDKKSIILGSSYYYDCETDTEGEYCPEGYTSVGEVSCGVWRWMAADVDTIKPDVLEKFEEEHEYTDVVRVDVPKGEWKMQHFYDFDKDSRIWARLDLVE